MGNVKTWGQEYNQFFWACATAHTVKQSTRIILPLFTLQSFWSGVWYTQEQHPRCAGPVSNISIAEAVVQCTFTPSALRHVFGLESGVCILGRLHSPALPLSKVNFPYLLVIIQTDYGAQTLTLSKENCANL